MDFYKRDVLLVVFEFMTKREVIRCQSVCKKWYERQIPKAITRFNIDNIKMKIVNLLKETPVGVNAEVFAMWKKTKIIPISVYERYFERGSVIEMFGNVNHRFDTWEDRQGWFCTGTRGSDGEYRGFIRRIYRKDGQMMEGTYQFGKFHGLQKLIWKTQVWIRLYDRGKPMALIDFDSDLREIRRGGSFKETLDDFGESDIKH